ncbi:Asp-tRNA(Asn)/Glu-tRNA(Gln) amidotransferase subunit GatB [Gammaproteobacteria bacterium]|nr:Asp-tRNA(Asn)/Glu-tRNA(Gln) amidotransferase subunit GatB [SAR86 cluster bacterium]MDB3975874.1 Asp-tRNA(Asn)/Glu-tRNA(Gln) amidotransferase subunit GatB [Gammaproteobacteria bacterium]
MNENLNNWEAVIGLEIHVQLSTKSKLFSGASTNFGALPNTQACNIDLAMPGVLPVLNEEVLKMAIKLGTALNADINSPTSFARKNYFYPDSPKGYQISQMDKPIVEGGYLDIETESGTKRIGVTRAHLEEDAGKSLHDDFEGQSGIDLNRAGTPLLEIVSEPEISTPAEAVAYLKSIHSIIRYLAISDGNMAEGSMRCDANVSVRKKGDLELGTRTETKNVNSFRFVEKAIQYEIERQVHEIESGNTITQETRLYDSQNNTTRPMRSKEYANDYRYFPEPDLLPITLEKDFIESVINDMPEMPNEKKERFVSKFSLSNYDADLLAADKDIANYFEEVVKISDSPKLSTNWIMGELSALLNNENLNIKDSKVSSDKLGQLILRIEDATISGKIAKDIFEKMWISGKEVDEIIQDEGLEQVTDDKQIEAMIDEVIKSNPEQLEQYRSGKDRLFGFFVGQVMQASKGKANPKQVNDILKSKLEK